jgi:hypothetical protein
MRRSHCATCNAVKEDTKADMEITTDGVNYFIFDVRKGGKEITVSGWTDHSIFQEGMLLVIKTKDDPARGSRYRVKEIRRMMDPSDQYFMDCVFAPRFIRNEQQAPAGLRDPVL